MRKRRCRRPSIAHAGARRRLGNGANADRPRPGHASRMANPLRARLGRLRDRGESVTLIASARMRLRLRDLAAAGAFASMALSGSVPTWATIAFGLGLLLDRKSTRLNSSHDQISYA